MKQLFTQAADANAAFKKHEVWFIILVILFSKFRKVFSQIFNVDEIGMELLMQGGWQAAGPNAVLAGIFKACWLLFLYVREKSGCSDLIPGFYVLLGCLDFVVSASPKNIREAAAPKDKGGTLLDAMSASNNCCLTALQKAMGDVETAAMELMKTGTLKGERQELFSAEEVGENLASLRVMVPAPSMPGGADGLLILESYPMVGIVQGKSQVEVGEVSSVPHGITPAAANPTAGKPPKQPQEDLMKTPERPTRTARITSMPATPVSIALRGANWLSDYVRDQAAEPDVELLRFFRSCSNGNPTEAINQRVAQAAALLEVSAIASSAGTKLYYKVLCHILKREEERLSTSDFSGMLDDENMHLALLAVCHELACHTFLPFSKLFPAVPRALGVSFFDLLVMLENFLRELEVQPESSFLKSSLSCIALCSWGH